MSERVPELFRRYPHLVGRIPWLPLGAFPTPVEPLRLPIEVPPGAELWIKRDDLSGRVYGGNKVRKLEFLLAAARREGARRLVTGGAAGSHHALATAIYGQAHGMPATLALFPQPLTPHVREVLLMDRAFGAELVFCRRMEMIPLRMRAALLARRSERPYLLVPGGSNALGTLGYVSAALELAAQVDAGVAPRPAVVHLTAGTVGTAAGLALGFALAGLETRIHATRVTSRIVANEWVLRSMVRSTARLLQRAGVPVPEPLDALRRVELRHGQIGRGYGHPTEAGERAAEIFAAAGIAADPTYIAKAAADMLDVVAAAPDGVHLFWSTLSAVEPTAAAGVGVEDLPPPFRRYLAAPAAPAAPRRGLDRGGEDGYVVRRLSSSAQALEWRPR